MYSVKGGHLETVRSLLKYKALRCDYQNEVGVCVVCVCVRACALCACVHVCVCVCVVCVCVCVCVCCVCVCVCVLGWTHLPEVVAEEYPIDHGSKRHHINSIWNDSQTRKKKQYTQY